MFRTSLAVVSANFRFSTRPLHTLSEIRSSLGKLGEGSVVLDLEYAPGIALITIKNERTRNAFSGKMMKEFAEVVDTLEETVKNTDLSGPLLDCIPGSLPDPKARKGLVGVILTGAGRTFCSGLDLDVARKHIHTSHAGMNMAVLMQDTTTRFRRLPLISVAAVEGVAIGGGAELTTAADFRIMARDSKIVFVQTAMGVSTAWGGGARLLSIVGRSQALHLLGSSLAMTPEYGREIHFVEGISESNEAVKAALKLLDPYVYLNPIPPYGEERNEGNSTRKVVSGVRGMKRIITTAETILPGFDQAVVVERNIFGTLWGSEENKLAVNRPRKSNKKGATRNYPEVPYPEVSRVPGNLYFRVAQVNLPG